VGTLTQENDSKKNLKCKILVVDDEPGCRRFLAWELKAQGYEVVTAENADRGLACLTEYDFPLVITDVRMRGSMDGIDFIASVRRRRPRQKSIFITGYAIEEKLQDALRHEGTRCLRKPFELDELLGAIRTLMEKL